MKRSKYGAERLEKLAYQDMIKRYKINFNPLLLPKLALLGYHLRNDPSFQVFLAKLQLFDKSAIQRENLFIQHMKQLLNDLERQEEIMMMGMERQTKREIKSCINLEEDKHQYGKILKSRLTDLNELIFHVQRLDREPHQEKQCKSLLQREINKITQIGYDSRKSKDEQERQAKKEGKQYFNLGQFKHNQMTKRNKDVDTMLKSNRVERKYKKAKTQAFDDVDTQDRQLDEELPSKKQTDNPLQLSDDEAASQVGEMVTTIQDNPHRKSTLKRRETSSRISTTGIKISRNPMQKAETEPNEQQGGMRFKKRLPGKSVRYNMKNSVENQQAVDSQKNKTTSIANIRSSRSIIRSDKQSSRGSQSQILSKSRHFLQTNTKKKSTKIDFTHEQAEHSEESQERADRSKSRVKTVKFNEQLIEEKNSYIKAKKYMRKFGRKETRLFLNRAQSIMGDQADNSDPNKQNEGVGSKRDLNSSKILRREGFQQQSNANILSSNRSVARMKRKGRILGLQANRHLQRLLMEQNIQEMLMDNELYDKSHQLFLKYKNKKNKGKYSSRKLVTDVNRSANRSRTGKHDILLQIDLDQVQAQDSKEYVSGQGFRVQYEDMKTMRQKYVQIMPYQHKIMGQFYGGQHFECINHQFNTNQHGRYYFNRLIMQTKNNSLDQYIPYDFPENDDKYESLRIDFGKKLCRQLSNFEQKDLQATSPLISFV